MTKRITTIVLSAALLMGFSANAAQAEGWSRTLERAAARSDESLAAAADDALELIEDARRAPTFGAARERSEFGELTGHLAAICRSIVGRPSNGTS